MKQNLKTGRKKILKILIGVFLIIVCLIVLFPFLWMLTNSIKTKDEIWAITPQFLPEVPQWGNYIKAFSDGKMLVYMWNSIYTSLIITIITLINSSLFAYAITCLQFRLKKFIWLMVLGAYIIPAAVTNIPSYIILARSGLLDTHFGYIASCCVSVFNIFYFRQSFRQIDYTLVEAAKVDGAKNLSIFLKIFVPMTVPSYITLGILGFIQNYNSYVWPSLILKSESKYLVSMGVRAFFSAEGAYGMEWGAIMAACCVIIGPLLLLFFICEKWIMKTITSDTSIIG